VVKSTLLSTGAIISVPSFCVKSFRKILLKK